MSSPSHSGDTFLPSRAHDTHLDDDGSGEGGDEDDQSGISDDSEMQ